MLFITVIFGLTPLVPRNQYLLTANIVPRILLHMRCRSLARIIRSLVIPLTSDMLYSHRDKSNGQSKVYQLQRGRLLKNKGTSGNLARFPSQCCGRISSMASHTSKSICFKRRVACCKRICQSNPIWSLRQVAQPWDPGIPNGEFSVAAVLG